MPTFRRVQKARPMPTARRCRGRRWAVPAFAALAAALLFALAAMAQAPGEEPPIPVNTGLPERVIRIERDGVELARFTVELALTAEEQRIGLMGRPELPKDRGMLFVHTFDHRPGMWMRNTLIPLDFLFVRANGTIAAIVHDVPPCPPDGPCPAYVSPEPVRMVLEILGGVSRELGLQPGDRLVLAGAEP